MSSKKLLIAAIFAVGVIFAPAQYVLAEGQTLSSAQKTFQEQIKSSMDELKKANEVRDRAVEVINRGIQGVKDAPQQVSNMIDALKELNSSYDEGSSYRNALDNLAAVIDEKIAETLAHPNQTVRMAAESLKQKRERVSELQQQALDLVQSGKALVRELEDTRSVAETLISIESIDTAIAVASEALEQYEKALTEFKGVAEKSNSVVAPSS